MAREVHHHHPPEGGGGDSNAGVYAILVVIVVLIVGAVLYFSGVLGPRATAEDDIDADIQIEAPEIPDVDAPDEVRIETPDIDVPDSITVSD